MEDQLQKDREMYERIERETKEIREWLAEQEKPDNIIEEFNLEVED